ncbi:MAG: type II secretion system F family protein [Polyangia bacterium]|nr:type II secretion system F family protein [Polyangia bacterium]
MLGLVVLFTFVSVFILVVVISGIMTWGVEQYEDRYATKGTKTLEGMFMFVTPRQIVLLSVSAMLVFFLLGLASLNLVAGLLLGVIGFLVPLMGIRHLRKKRIAKFNRQLVDSLVQMSAAFKAGLTLPQAAENIAREMPPPLGQEFDLLVKEIKLGITVEEALENTAARVGSDDMELVVVSTNISRKLGGNMAEMYDIIAGTIRERFRLEGKIQSLVAQGKMQAWVVALMPLAIGIALNHCRPDLMQPMLHHRFGYILIGCIILMELMGIWLIRRIVNIDV